MTGKKRRQQRRKGSLRRYTLYYLLALFLLAGIGLLLSVTVFFRVASIRVTGNTVYAEDAIIETSGIQKGDNLVRLAVSEAAERIRAAYPYLETVRVRRVFPDSVEIAVTVAEETAALRGEDGTYTILSADGRALRTGVALCPEGLIPADGFSLLADGKKEGETAPLTAGAMLTSAEESRFAALLEILEDLKTTELTDSIDLIDLRELLEIRLLYDGRIAILLGGSSDLAYKLRFAAAAIAENVTEETVGTLDVSQKPSARLRECNLYDTEVWPFAADLLPEYERHIVRQTPWNEEETEEGSQSEEPSFAPIPEAEEQSSPETPAPEAMPIEEDGTTSSAEENPEEEDFETESEF